MNRDCIPLAKKYAVAYFNVFKHELNQNEMKNIENIGIFFEQHPEILFFLKLPAKFDGVKIHVLKRVGEKIGLSKNLLTLINVLLAQQRLYMFPAVCHCIKEVFDQKNNIIHAMLESSHELSESQQDSLHHYFEQLSGKKIEMNNVINPHLIGGIRLQADTLLWEYSIKKQLRNAERLLTNGD